MNLKTLFYIFIYAIFAISCNESIIESETLTPQTPELKAATIGTTYFVAKTGNDNNSGLLSAPFLTIQKAANIVNPGDIVIVRDGVYSNSTPNYGNEIVIVRMTRSGNSSNWITFKAEHKGGAILDGLNFKANHGIMIDGASFIKIEGFEIKAVSLWGMPIFAGSNLNISSNHIHNIGRISTDTNNGISGIVLNNTSNIVIENNSIHDVGRLTPTEGGSSTSDYKYHDHGIYVNNVNTLTIKTNTLFNIQSGWAVHFYSGSNLPSSNISVINNTFAFCGKFTVGLIVLYTPLTNVKIQNNIFYHNADAVMKTTPSANCGISINSAYPFNSVVINHNIISGGSGLMVSSAVSGVSVSSNLEKTDPSMVSPSTFNFILKSTSLAINAGVSVGTTTDFLGNAIVGLPDIGAYEYTLTSSTPKTYYNSQVSASVTKNSCGTGYTGSVVTYTVSANKYSSTVSQVDADSKATDDLNLNKQTYANANGTCTAISKTIYYNTAKSGTATKNDCGTGYTGSVVTGTVPAKYFSSTISQADADNKAIALVKSGIQAYANANGTCTKTTTNLWQRIF